MTEIRQEFKDRIAQLPEEHRALATLLAESAERCIAAQIEEQQTWTPEQKAEWDTVFASQFTSQVMWHLSTKEARKT